MPRELSGHTKIQMSQVFFEIKKRLGLPGAKDVCVAYENFLWAVFQMESCCRSISADGKSSVRRSAANRQDTKGNAGVNHVEKGSECLQGRDPVI